MDSAISLEIWTRGGRAQGHMRCLPTKYQALRLAYNPAAPVAWSDNEKRVYVLRAHFIKDKFKNVGADTHAYSVTRLHKIL